MQAQNSGRGGAPNQQTAPLSREELAALRRRDQQLSKDLLAAVLSAGNAATLPGAAQRFRAEWQRLMDEAAAARQQGQRLTEARQQVEPLEQHAAATQKELAKAEAAWAELLPSVYFNADYGDIGPTWGSALGTYSVAAAVRIPLFQGGRERGRILQADAALAQARSQAADLRVRIELEVRSAFLDLRAADERVHVAQVAADLAGQQLTQTEDRFAAGVASHVEVVQAQDAVATASDNLINSLFAHNLAKAALARALGVAEQTAERLLGGQQ